MADPKAEEFDPDERICGFSMLSIKRAMQLIGIMEDRDDVDHVADSLCCPPQQALRVLEELEQRGLVTKAQKKRQWDTTQKGHRLALHWHPPRVLRPAIEYEAGAGSINEQFKAVPCSIWRYTPDDDEMFEEGEIDVGVHVDYDHDRLIEINISQIDEYQGESNGAALCERSVYISPADARSFLSGLQEAIERAGKEAALRVTQKVHREKRDEAKRLRRAKKNDERLAQRGDDDPGLHAAPPGVEDAASPKTPAPGAQASTKLGPATTTKTSTKGKPAIQRVTATLPATAPPAEATRSKKAAAAALAELREVNRARLERTRKKAQKVGQ
jgi:hypothetical protein